MASPEPVAPATPPAAPATTTTTSDESKDVQQRVSPEDLIDLIHAIKFAKDDASQRQVWKEISEELSQKEGFEFLAKVALNDVKKVWKKALKTAGGSSSNNTNNNNNNNNNNSNANTNNAAKAQEKPSTEKATEVTTDALKTKLLEVRSKPSIFTVGQLAQEYKAMTIAEALAVGEQEQQKHALEMEGYVHIFLDVPADRSGTKPHQALISFQKDTTKKASKSKTPKAINNHDGTNHTTATEDEPLQFIVKIQRAAPMHSDDTTSYPMLCYDQSKTRKTFLHPDSDPDGYHKIANLIEASGKEGALKHMGGTKAYFYARMASLAADGKGRASNIIISINTVELAPPQSW